MSWRRRLEQEAASAKEKDRLRIEELERARQEERSNFERELKADTDVIAIIDEAILMVPRFFKVDKLPPQPGAEGVCAGVLAGRR